MSDDNLKVERLTLNLLDLTNDTFTTSQAINIPQQVVGGNGYVGFTGSRWFQQLRHFLAGPTARNLCLPCSRAAGFLHAAQNHCIAASLTPKFTTTDGASTASSNAYSGPHCCRFVGNNQQRRDQSNGRQQQRCQRSICDSSGNSPAVPFTLTGGSIPASRQAGPGLPSHHSLRPADLPGVSLSCAITSSPASAVDPPTCSVSQPGTPAPRPRPLTTLGASTAALHYQRRPFVRLGEEDACGHHSSYGFRRNRQAMFWVLLVATLAVVSGCGVESPTTTQVTGLTAGAYTSQLPAPAVLCNQPRMSP